MSTELMSQSENEPDMHPQTSSLAEVRRAVERIRAPMIIAREFPRNEINATVKIKETCKRFALAEKAFYSYARGGATVNGPSIRLLEAISQIWGNMRAGFQVLSRTNEGARVRSFAVDYETNFELEREFDVKFEKVAQGRIKPVTDPRDQNELIANFAARNTRECLKGVVPGDVVELAITQCRLTLAHGAKTGEKPEPMADRIKRIVGKFNEIGVSREMLETKLGHKVELMIADQFVDLQGVFNAIRDGASKREDFFELTPADRQGAPSSLNETLGISKKETK